MELVTRSVGILLGRKEVGAYARQVAEAADQNRESLGWFPFKVFEESATREKLIVAVVREGGQEIYAGHLLFETTFPRGHVLQIHVLPPHRRYGLATALLNHLKTHLTTLNFISIGARVAEDLREAQEFWQRQGFYVRKIVAGGKTRGRTLAVRAHELPTRQLFAPSGITHRDPLGLAASDSASTTQLFLLDLNVLFDLGPRRARHDDVVDLFAFERKGICRLALSTEFDAELARTAKAGKTDPMQGFGRIFPKFAAPAGADWDLLVKVTLPPKSVPHNRATNWLAWPEPHASLSRTASD